MKDAVFYFYGYVIFFYSLGLISFYVFHLILSRLGIYKNKNSLDMNYAKHIIEDNDYTPGVSIVAPDRKSVL